MKRTLLTGLITLATLLAYAPGAEARPCCYGYRVQYYRVHPHYNVLHRAPSPPRWAVGLHLTGMGTDQMFANEPVVLGGIGGHLRFRGYRWGGELAISALGAEFLHGRISRVSVPIQASALLYLIPEGVFNLYLLGGFRVQPTVITLDYPQVHDEQGFAEFGFQGGLGADINLGHWVALTGDLRFFGVMRSDANPSGEYYAGIEEAALLPSDSTGVQFNLGVSFRF